MNAVDRSDSGRRTELDRAVVYPSKGGFALIAVFCGANAAWIGALLVYAIRDVARHPDRGGLYLGLVLGLLLFLVVAIPAAWFTGELVLALLRPRPVLILDRDGLEWREGRIWWSDVERMEVFRTEGYSGDSHWRRTELAISVRPGVEPLPAIHQFAVSYGARDEGPRWAPDRRLEVTLSDDLSTPLSIETVRGFYPGPIIDRGLISEQDREAVRALYQLHESRRASKRD